MEDMMRWFQSEGAREKQSQWEINQIESLKIKLEIRFDFTKMKNIRRSLGLEQIYRLKRCQEFTENHTEATGTEIGEEKHEIPPEVPQRDYEIYHYDYVPKPTFSICSDASEAWSDTSLQFESTSGKKTGRVRNLLHKIKMSPFKSRQKNPKFSLSPIRINKLP